MNTNLTAVDAEDSRSVTEIVIVCILLSIIILASILGNIVVIIAVFINHHLKDEVSSAFIVNLAITDLSSATIVMASALVAIGMDSWHLGEIWCDFVCMANYCFIIVSMLTLCFISIDRYIAVVHPLHYPRRVTEKKVKLIIAYSWFQGVVFAVIPALFRWIKYDYWEGVCAIQWHQEREQALYYVIAAFIACFLTPGVVLAMCYSQILKKARKQATTESGSQVSIKYSTSKKAMYGFLVVVFAFFVCMTPFSCTKLFKVTVDKDNALPNYVNLSSSIIAYIASALNPLIYGIFRKDFRIAFKLMYKKYITRRSVIPIRNNDLHLSDINL